MTIPYNRLLKPGLGTLLQKTHPLTRGLVGCWLFNEGGGGQVIDLSGNGKNLTLGANTLWEPAKFGIGLDCNGAEKHASGGGATFNHSQGAVVAWVKFDEDYGAVVTSSDEAGSQTYLYLRHRPDDKLRIQQRNADTEDSIETTNACVGRTVFHQVVYLSTGSSYKIYVDGVNQALSVLGGSNNGDWFADTAGRDNFFIGRLERDAGEEDSALGTCDYVMIYDRALSVPEIAQLYREPFCMFKDPNENAILGGYTAPIGGIPILRRRRAG